MPLNAGDNVFEAVWPNNTTPQAPDGTGSSAVSLCGWVLQNTAAAARYVRFFDKASAPTMGTDKAKLVVPLAAASTPGPVMLPRPVLFKSGLWVSVTTGQADTDATAPAAGDVLANVLFQ